MGQGPVAETLLGRGPVAQSPMGRGPVAETPPGRGPASQYPLERGPVDESPQGRGPALQSLSGREPSDSPDTFEVNGGSDPDHWTSTASQWTSVEDDCTALQSMGQCCTNQGLHVDCTRKSLELQSLGQRTAGAGQQLSTTAVHTQGTNTEDSQAALQSLDQRFTDKDRRLPVATRTQSLDRRFGGTDERLSTVGPSHLWSMVKAHDGGADRQSLHERFTCKRDSSTLSGSAARPFSGTLDNGGSGHSLVTADRLPSFVAARQDNDGLHASPSRGTETNDAATGLWSNLHICRS